jgi:hypothetical protein
VEYNGNITLSTSPGGTGLFHINGSDSNPNTFVFDSASPPSITYSSTSATGLITIIASGDGPISGNTDIEVREALIADTITLKADPKNILAGGLGGTEGKITATIKQGFTVINNYNRDITFEIISDTSTSGDAGLSLTVDGVPYDTLTVPGGDVVDGVAEVYLEPATEVGICTVKVSTENSEGTLIENTIEVGFYSGEHHIKLEASPPKMLVNGDTCEVTATVKDEKGVTVVTYEEDITFTILVGWPKNAKFAETGTSSLTKTLSGGIATVILISQSTAGTVTLKASSFTDITDISGYLNIPVSISLINLVEDSPAYSSTATENKVTFDISVQGAEILLGDMKVSWPDNIPSELINKIDIGGSEVYYNVEGVVSGTVVNIVPTGLLTDTYTIDLYFNLDADMSGKTYNIIFNPDDGNYPVEFELPST